MGVNPSKPGPKIRSNQASNNPKLNRDGATVINNFNNNGNQAGQTYPYYVQPSCRGFFGCGAQAIGSLFLGGLY